ncbi:MAG: DUF456 domain-containing protein [Anaerolineales bacterium]|nr:DUF456 domain-containing protein [Anaerolineales bacterium]
MPDWLNTSITVLIQLILLVGLFGLVVPIFPGLVVMWLATLGYGIVTGFGTLGIILFIIITLLMLVGSIADNFMMGAGARKGGASWLAIGVALVAGVVGTILWPPIGGLIAAPLGVFLFELARKRDFKKAWGAFLGLATGWGLSFFVRFGVGVLILLTWWLWVWQG